MSRANLLRFLTGSCRVAIVSTAALGCGSTLPSSALPRVTPPPADPDAECLRLGAVVGTADPFFGGLESEAELVESARREALTLGLRAGATHVRFAEQPKRWPSGTFGGGQGITVVGVAYNCAAAKPAHPAPPTTTPPPAAPAGCAKDTDCKGDRICQAGACTDPVRRPEPPAR
jgi:hypothetical protein